MRLYPRRKRNGSIVWWASWTENKVTVRRSTRQPTRALAQVYLERVARERADPEREAARQAKFGDEAATFLRECRAAKLADGTIEMYEQKLANLCDLLGRDTPMADINAQTVSEYFDTRRGEGAADSTLFKEWVALKGVLTSARHRGRFMRDPRAVRPLRLAANYEPRKTFLSWHQADRLLDSFTGDRKRTLAYVLATGARRREWENAQAGDVDGVRVLLRGSKTDAAEAVITVPSPMRRWLKLAGQPPLPAWQNARRDILVVCAKLRKDDPSFPDVTWNDLRRTFASLLVQAGVFPHLVAKLLRHTSTAMVDKVYGRQTDDALAELVERAMTRNPSVNQRRRTPGNRSKRRGT
jgi:integrase